MQYDTHIKCNKQLHLTVNTVKRKCTTHSEQNHSIKTTKKTNIPAVPNSIRLHSLAFSFATSFALTNDSISVRVLSF